MDFRLVHTHPTHLRNLIEFLRTYYLVLFTSFFFVTNEIFKFSPRDKIIIFINFSFSLLSCKFCTLFNILWRRPCVRSCAYGEFTLIHCRFMKIYYKVKFFHYYKLLL